MTLRRFTFPCLVLAFVLVVSAVVFHEKLGQIWGVVHEKYFLTKEEKLQREEAILRQKFAAFFACKPEKPLSREELLARAMQNYWRNEMKALWETDQMLYEEHIPHEKTDYTDTLCGLERDEQGNPVRITRNTCYPWKITEYNSREKLCARIQEVPALLDELWKAKERRLHEDLEKDSRTGILRTRIWREDGLTTYEDIVRDILRGQVIHPEAELPYSPEDLNDGKASFAIMHNAGPWIAWYEPDCCRLMSYDDIKEKKTTLFLDSKARYLPADVRIEDVTFLEVTYRFIDSPWPNDGRRQGVFSLKRGKIAEYSWELSPVTLHFLVSPCGAIDWL